METPKIGDRVEMLKGVSYADIGDTGKIIDPAGTYYGASEKNPNMDAKGYYWALFERTGDVPICIGPSRFFHVTKGD